MIKKERNNIKTV